MTIDSYLLFAQQLKYFQLNEGNYIFLYFTTTSSSVVDRESQSVIEWYINMKIMFAV
jgi:hypothetical protein